VHWERVFNVGFLAQWSAEFSPILLFLAPGTPLYEVLFIPEAAVLPWDRLKQPRRQLFYAN
jgi:hypothetical protein